MKPWVVVDRAQVEGGSELVLARRDTEWSIRVDGRVLMSSRAHHSEDALARLALARAPAPLRRILVGGLGLGYTLRAALERLAPTAQVVVAELSPVLAAWNRGPLAHLAGRPLEDTRVLLRVGDVVDCLREARQAYGAILLDVDNGPSALSHPENDRLYGEPGIATCRAALVPGGVLALWSAGPDARYRTRLERAHFRVEEVPVTVHGTGGRRHIVYVARAEGPPRGQSGGGRPGRRPSPSRPR